VNLKSIILLITYYNFENLGKIVWADPIVADRMRSRIPMNRFAEPEEVADAVAYLLSDSASMITGSCIPVDGGFLAS
jgi:L-xylulose reductase